MILGIGHALRTQKSQELKRRRRSRLEELKWSEAQKRFPPPLQPDNFELPRIQIQSLRDIERDYERMDFKASFLIRRLMQLLRMSKRARILDKTSESAHKKEDTRITIENTRFLNAQSDCKTHFWGGKLYVQLSN